MNNKQTNIKKIVLIIVVLVLLVVGCYVLTKQLSKSETDVLNNISNNSNAYTIKINGKNNSLSINLTDLLENKLYCYSNSGDALNPFEQEKYWQSLTLNPQGVGRFDKGYVAFPSAKVSKHATGFDALLVHKKDSDMKDESNYTVVGYTATNISKDFFSINGLGCGSTVREFIKAFNVDLNAPNTFKVTNSKNEALLTYLEFYDEKSDIKIELNMDTHDTSETVYKIRIELNNTSKYAE